MIITKVHEIISFKQSKWLEKYITFNTQKPNKARSEFEKDSYKLINSGAFGKFSEIVRNRLRKFLLKIVNMIKLLNSSQIQHSMVFINHIQIIIFIHSNKLKWL